MEPFYKGGKVQVPAPGTGGVVGGTGSRCPALPLLRPLCVQLDQPGQHLFCICGTRVNILDVASGAVLRSLEQVSSGEQVGGWVRGQPFLMVLCALALSLRRTKKTSLPLTSAQMMRHVGLGWEVSSVASLHTARGQEAHLPAELHIPQVLVTASRALLLAQWSWREGSITRLWKAVHTAPVATMAFDPTSTLLATGRVSAGQVGWRAQGRGFEHTGPLTSNIPAGGCDGAVRVWDVVRHYGTHHLRGSPGVVQ